MTIIFSLGTFGGSEESDLLDELLSAYNDGDEEAATSVLARPYIRYMDNAVSKSQIVDPW